MLGVTLTLDGITLNITAWAKRLGLSRVRIYQRLEKFSTVREVLAPRQRGRRSEPAHGGSSPHAAHMAPRPDSPLT